MTAPNVTPRPADEWADVAVLLAVLIPLAAVVGGLTAWIVDRFTRRKG